MHLCRSKRASLAIPRNRSRSPALNLLVNKPQRDWWYEGTKRATDIVLGLLVLILSLPILLAAALLVRLDSSGSSLFWQQRVGRYGYLFDLCRFRSMREDAPKYSCSPTNPKDPRITPFGRVFRHASFDELPQLFNVLKGNMSFVGPRPEMPFIAQQYNAEQRKRLDVIPGITGLWQLSADRACAIHKNICYDLYYIRHRSFLGYRDLASHARCSDAGSLAGGRCDRTRQQNRSKS